MNNPHDSGYPGKLQAIGILQTVIGSLEIIVGFIWGIWVLIVGVATFGVGLLAIPLPVLYISVGILCLISGIKGLQRTPAHGLALGVAIAQMPAIFVCDLFSFGAGLATLILLFQPEVKAFFGR